MKIIAFLTPFIFPLLCFSQTPGADKVSSYHFGINTSFGQSNDFFPQNVLGNPDTTATFFAPSSSEENVASLGLNGWIILEFTDNLIRDFPGPDFTVFENAFFIGNDTTKIWKEPGIVSVSKNGFDFVVFPYDSISFYGCAGTKPTNGKVNPQDNFKSGGNQFDLASIGIDSIRFVRIDDRSRWVLGGGGFDLDAVVAIHSDFRTGIKSNKAKTNDLNLTNYPNPFNPVTTLEWESREENSNQEIEIFSITGTKIKSLKSDGIRSGKQSIKIDLSDYASGIYFVLLKSGNKVSLRQIQLLK